MSTYRYCAERPVLSRLKRPDDDAALDTAIRALHRCADECGARSVTLTVRDDGRFELRTNSQHGYLLYTVEGDVHRDDNVSQHPLTSDDVNHLMVESIAWREKRGLK